MTKINWEKTAAVAGVAGFALFVLTNQEVQSAIGGFFGSKTAKTGTVGGGALPTSDPFVENTETVTAPVTKKESTNYTPQTFGYVQPTQDLLDNYYQRNIEPTLFTPKGVGGIPLSYSTEMKAVDTAAKGYGDSGVYLSQPGGNLVSSKKGGTGMIPFGVGDDYKAPSSSYIYSGAKFPTVETPVKKSATPAVVSSGGGSTGQAYSHSSSSNAPTSRSTFTSAGWVTRY